MSNEATSVAAGNLEEIVGILGLTTEGLDMRHHFPQDVPVGRGCGIFFGLGGGGHIPAGDGKLAALTETRLHLAGKFKLPWDEGSAEVEIELLGNGKARLRSEVLVPQGLRSRRREAGPVAAPVSPGRAAEARPVPCIPAGRTCTSARPRPETPI
jgi:hypothetical protein